MTFCKLLKKTSLPNGDTVEAYARTEKFESTATYQVVISRNGIAYDVIPCAKSTWRKRFASVLRDNIPAQTQKRE